MVLCVDEKSQIQALERSQPMLPLGLGYVEGMTHDYKRHGTTTLFAALDVASGEVMTQCKSRHRHQECLQFLRHIEANVPADLEIHLVVDNNSSSTTTPPIGMSRSSDGWPAAPVSRSLHSYVCFVAQSSGDLVQFPHPQGDSARSFRKVSKLVGRIERFTAQWNAKPFV